MFSTGKGWGSLKIPNKKPALQRRKGSIGWRWLESCERGREPARPVNGRVWAGEGKAGRVSGLATRGIQGGFQQRAFQVPQRAEPGSGLNSTACEHL